MIVVIQCAAKKQEQAGHLTTADGRKVLFVADPSSAPESGKYLYVRPDDQFDSRHTWRDYLVRYNCNTPRNENNLCTAIDLYANRTYSRLADTLGTRYIYILSAGWGLIRGDFLTPNYDITFSASAECYKRRRNSDTFHDLNMLSPNIDEPIIFFGGKDYIPLFCKLTNSLTVEKVVYYNSVIPPEAPGCTLVRFQTRTRTNWHYECLNTFLDSLVRQKHLDDQI